MSKIGKDECKEKKLKKKFIPIHPRGQNGWMQGKKKDECISIHPFHLEMCVCCSQRKTPYFHT
jgi:hypothetical protein